jgi:Deoxyribonuclease II/Bacterial SH3 domain
LKVIERVRKTSAGENMNTFASRGRQSIYVTVLIFFVIVLWAALSHAATVTPSDAVATYVVVRALPSTKSAKIGKFSPGYRAEVLEAVPQWEKVKLANGLVGYVSAKWVTEAEPMSPKRGGTEQISVTGATAPMPLLTTGHPVSWWFVFKFNAAKFPGCSPGATPQCSFGGQVQSYTASNPPASSQQFVYASSESPALQKGAGCVGDKDADPVGATFGQVYNGSFHYVVWNDQFYNSPPIVGCPKFCDAPWGHSKGIIAWNDDAEGFLMQVTTPSWPAAGSYAVPRENDGNTLGCTQDNNVKFSQHFFALRLNHDDIVKVLKGLQIASVATDPAKRQIVSNGGPQDVQDLVTRLGVQSQNTVATIVTLSTGVGLISKPSALHVPPWQMVSALLGGIPLRVATWWSASKINSTTFETPIGCWNAALGRPGPVEIATSGQWNGISFGLTGGVSSGDHNHAKIGVSTSSSHHYAIFGDMNQEGALSESTPGGCAVQQNGQGGLFFVVDNPALASSIGDLINGATAPTD